MRRSSLLVTFLLIVLLRLGLKMARAQHQGLKRRESVGEKKNKEEEVGFKTLEQVLHEEYAQLEAERKNELNSASNVFFTASLSCNQYKNRYSNNLPNEDTRVKLEGEQEQGTDYINANFIKGQGQTMYIAAQAPLSATISDFWRMIYEQNAHTLVMLTRLQENGMSKALRYWPETVGASRRYGEMHVTFVQEKRINSEISVRTFGVRKMSRQPLLFMDDDDNNGEQQGHNKKDQFPVLQIHYQGWPDFGRPRDSRCFKLLLELIEENNLKTGNHTIVTHCSAGLGRTGTLIAAHIALQQLKEGVVTSCEDMSVQKMVRDLRRQRTGMVQTLEQYIFIHEIVRNLCDEFFGGKFSREKLSLSVLEEKTDSELSESEGEGIHESNEEEEEEALNSDQDSDSENDDLEEEEDENDDDDSDSDDGDDDDSASDSDSDDDEEEDNNNNNNNNINNNNNNKINFQLRRSQDDMAIAVTSPVGMKGGMGVKTSSATSSSSSSSSPPVSAGHGTSAAAHSSLAITANA
jgi:protein tyrosine phosphatase